MTDEKFMFVSDVADKKRTARGIHNKRTHTGKGGTVKFPSDYCSKKEIEAMNGDVKSYRMNEPMQWDEFKNLPDDIKVLYIKALRNKFGAPDIEIYKMMGGSRSNFSYMMKKIGCSIGHGGLDKSFDADGWQKWLHGVKTEDQETAEVENVPAAISENTSEPEDANEPESEWCVTLMDKIIQQDKTIKQLEAKNAILEAKLSMVYLIFGQEGEKE